MYGVPTGNDAGHARVFRTVLWNMIGVELAPNCLLMQAIGEFDGR